MYNCFMTKNQKIRLWIFGILFIVSEILWGPFLSIAYKFGILINPILIKSAIFEDGVVFQYLIVLFEIFCLFQLAKPSLSLVRENKKHILVLVPAFLLILSLIFILFLVHSLNNFDLVPL